MFTKILIANRGEIACRVMRTAQRLGIRCVAVYSEADANALHVKMADEAYCIGPAPSRESYLRGDHIIEIALKAGAQAIHPGYGFLSENAEFAEKCAAAGICFIGPPPAAIRAMGSKSKAKEIMEKARVPLVPGYHGDKQDLNTLQTAAEKIGYPVILKAAAGGGGKGMRVVSQAQDFDAALSSAKREAKSSFGNDLILVEKYLTKPRHIEIQVFADTKENTIYLFERDCSIQRRHQKIVEEAPAPKVSTELRQRMGEAAIAAAKAIGYVGAGTIEFLLDVDGSFYFMEMNTRLQVEHPVTEMITRQDLVEWQIRVAQGEPLPLRQDELKIHGHAIETRIYAEDPNNDFLPSIGKIKYLKTPHENNHVRIDTGFIQGDVISPYYDPMITKLIVWDHDRDAAIVRLQQALADYQVIGVTTNLNLLTAIAKNSAYAAAELDTAFIPNHHEELFTVKPVTVNILALASVYILHLQQQKAENLSKSSADPHSPWNHLNGWRLNQPAQQTLHFQTEQEITVVVDYRPDGYVLKCADLKRPHPQPLSPRFAPGEGSKNVDPLSHPAPGEGSNISAVEITENDVAVIANGQHLKANIYVESNQIYLLHLGVRYQFSLLNDQQNYEQETDIKSHLTAPMPGKVVALLATAGTEVEQGAGLAVIEAMKMEHTIHAPSKGMVKEWYFQVGDLVDEGIELLKFEEKTA